LKYKAIIFDFDGVILDSVNIKTQAFEAMYLPYGKEVAKKVRKHHLLNGGISRYKKLRHYHQDFLGIDLTDNEVERMAQEFSNLVFRKVLESPFITGADLFLQSYGNKLSLFVATGTPQNEIEQIIRSRNLTQYFVSVHGSPTSKESIIENILLRHELRTKDVLFVGDAMTDYIAAQQSNIDFIGVSSDLTSFPKSTVIIKNLTELKVIFDETLQHMNRM